MRRACWVLTKWHASLEEVQRAGAKLVLVGDPEQLQAILAGAAFRAILERVGFEELTEIRRQRESLATGGYQSPRHAPDG